MTQQVGGWAGFRQLNGDAAKADLVTTDFIDILDTIDVPILPPRHDAKVHQC